VAESLTIRKAIEKLLDGTIRIPGFQRGYVWEPSRAALLVDSLYKGYPVGSLLLWRTRNQLKTEKRLGVFDLPAPDKDYPVDYVLDGQQRLTSIFATFQTQLDAAEVNPEIWLPVYYDFLAAADAQESRFVALEDSEFDPERHFPLRTFLDPVEFARLSRELSDERNAEIAEVQQKFVAALIPVETFESEDRASVAIVFERVNRMGVELDVFQLLTAWTWSDEFDLQQEFLDLAAEFADFGFADVGHDSDLMLRCTAAALRNDPSPDSLVSMTGAEVRENFETVANALRRAIDFVKTNFLIRNLDLLPYSALLIPLTAFFYIRPGDPITAAQREALVRWIWLASFSRRYSGNPQRNIRQDIEEAVKLRNGEVSSLDALQFVVTKDFFSDNTFSVRTVATKSLILLLAQQHPLTFLSGEVINLERVLAEANRSEFHHCHPRADLVRSGFPPEAINALANFAIISRAENRTISDKKPSEYRALMPANTDDVLAHAICPDTLFTDDYARFLDERAELLAQAATVVIA